MSESFQFLIGKFQSAIKLQQFFSGRVTSSRR